MNILSPFHIRFREALSWRYAVALLRLDAIDGSLKETNVIRQEILEKIEARYLNGVAPV